MRSGWANRGHPAFWAFVVHRISGVLLAVFLPLHFVALSQALAGASALDAFLAWTRNPWVMATEVAVVFLLAAHFTGGLRLLAIEFIGWKGESQKALLALASGGAVCFALLFALNLV